MLCPRPRSRQRIEGGFLWSAPLSSRSELSEGKASAEKQRRLITKKNLVIYLRKDKEREVVESSISFSRRKPFLEDVDSGRYEIG